MTTESSAARKRLAHRSRQRGRREMDLLFARFAEAVLPDLPPAKFTEYQALLDLPDSLLLDWVLETQTPPEHKADSLLALFLRLARETLPATRAARRQPSVTAIDAAARRRQRPRQEKSPRQIRLNLANAPAGADAKWLATAAEEGGGTLLYIASSYQRVEFLNEAVKFFAPKLKRARLVPWDCLPFEPRSPDASLSAGRMAALLSLASPRPPDIVLTTAAASLQYLPPRAYVKEQTLDLQSGQDLRARLLKFLAQAGYERRALVAERGDYARRGSVIDLFPPTADTPLRLDFFGDTLETLHEFDTVSQRNTKPLKRRITLGAGRELALNQDMRATFCRNYRARFGIPEQKDASLYHALATETEDTENTEGIEHYLPLCFDRLESIFTHAGATRIALDEAAFAAAESYTEELATIHAQRKTQSESERALTPPLAPEELYLPLAQWKKTIAATQHNVIYPLDAPKPKQDCGGTPNQSLAPLRQQGKNVFEHFGKLVRDSAKKNSRVVLATTGTRIQKQIEPYAKGKRVPNFASRLPKNHYGITSLQLEQGFHDKSLHLIAESELTGHTRAQTRRTRARVKKLQLGTLTPQALVIHEQHGLGRFEGLQTLTIDGAPHDCLQIAYAQSARLYVPVEHADLLSPYASDTAALDTLGGQAFALKKARAKKRIKFMADELMRVAAKRVLNTIPPLNLPTDGSYDAFCAGFAYALTPDQAEAIDAVLDDLKQGRAMDRLICGDVGFGKTEIALRAAFAVAMSGGQCALLAPTSLLVRQHIEQFRARFAAFPIRIGALSRLQTGRRATQTKRELANGQMDIVIGTHALLAKDVQFKNLRLLMIDEEQHFGVRHKERLKAFRGGSHVLALSATPIPRSLQMSLSGLREFSLMTSAPPGRLEIITQIGAFDTLTIRQALLREHERQGQSFFICPRIQDLERRAPLLRKEVPELRVVIAHGRLPSNVLDARVRAFYSGEFDVLLSTSIVESGLDIPRANTIVIDDAHKFGLGQLYQMRGRVGRSSRRAYAYIVYPLPERLADPAKKRLAALRALGGPGAGFALASQDLELRGGGNLLGEEQSGHIKEVGFALYQRMLEEAVQTSRDDTTEKDDAPAPQLALGCAALIEENYIPDFEVRMQIYRRLASVADEAELAALKDELTERFGERPQALDQLLAIVALKLRCRALGITHLQAGTKGVRVAFFQDKFAAPQALLEYLQTRPDIQLRRDQSLFFRAALPSEANRLQKARVVLQTLQDLAGLDLTEQT